MLTVVGYLLCLTIIVGVLWTFGAWTLQIRHAGRRRREHDQHLHAYLGAAPPMHEGAGMSYSEFVHAAAEIAALPETPELFDQEQAA